MSVLAIIPARGGSKGVKQKNLRMLGGIPLIGHTANAALKSGIYSRIVVSTDDPAITRWAELNGFEVHRRSAHAASDSATIADVANEVVRDLDWRGTTVSVLQPTSPFRSSRSIKEAYQQFNEDKNDSMMSVVRLEHMHWFDEGESFRPLFEERVNRQYARHAVLQETGAIQFVRTEVLKESGVMVQARHGLYEISASESLDIDTTEDFAIARFRFESRCLIVFRITANRMVGTGHLFHCLQLAQELDSLNIVFLLKDCDDFVSELLTQERYEFVRESNLVEDLARIGDSFDRRVLVNDILDTELSDVLVPKLNNYSVVCVEDLGPGSEYADLVVNALYPTQLKASRAKELVGAEYAVLRPEFLINTSLSWREHGRVLVTFGGSDPAGLTSRIVPSLREALPPEYEVKVILGIAAPDFNPPQGVVVTRTPNSMAVEMAAADVIVTSAGRTVLEAAAVGTPVVVVAQNAREATHSHLSYDRGVLFLGLGNLIQAADVSQAVSGLLESPSLRQEISTRLRKNVSGDGARKIASNILDLLAVEEN